MRVRAGLADEYAADGLGMVGGQADRPAIRNVQVDVKTAFDVAKPSVVSKISPSHRSPWTRGGGPIDIDAGRERLGMFRDL